MSHSRKKPSGRRASRPAARGSHAARTEPDHHAQPSALQRITRFWVSCLVILIILYAALLFVSRTDGFRDLVRENLERRFDHALVIEGTTLTPGCNLKLEGVRSRKEEGDGPGDLRVASAELELSLLSWVRGNGWVTDVKIDGCAVMMAIDETGSWQPGLFAGAAGWVSAQLGISGVPGSESPGASSASPTGVDASDTGPEARRRSFPGITLTDGAFQWYDAGGNLLAAASGVGLVVTSVRVPGRSIHYIHLKLDRADVAGMTMAADLDTEILSTGDQHMVLTLQGELRGGFLRAAHGEAEARKARDLMRRYEVENGP